MVARNVADAPEREAQPEPATPAAASPIPLAVEPGAGLASGGQRPPSLSRPLVMRLQATAGNAAVSALMEDRRDAPGGVAQSAAIPTAADTAVMTAMAGQAKRSSSVAREPIVMDEQT